MPDTDHKRNANEESQYLTERGETMGKTFFNLFYSLTKKPWFPESDFSREFIVTINRCRSDHYNFAASLNHIGIISNTSCQYNKTEETLNQVLWQRTLYGKPRTQLLKSFSNLNFYPPLNVEIFITKSNILACQCIFTFLKDYNLKI